MHSLRRWEVEVKVYGGQRENKIFPFVDNGVFYSQYATLMAAQAFSGHSE